MKTIHSLPMRRFAMALVCGGLLSAAFSPSAQAQQQTVNAICSTDQPWCEAAAR